MGDLEKRAVGAMLGEQEVGLIQEIVMSRAETKDQLNGMFNTAKENRKTERALMESLFIQTPAAVTMANNLQKEANALVTANVDAFFEKHAQDNLTPAQRRFPELLKVASKNR